MMDMRMISENPFDDVADPAKCDLLSVHFMQAGHNPKSLPVMYSVCTLSLYRG